VRIGDFELGDLAAGTWRELDIEERKRVLAGLKPKAKPRVAPKRRRPQTSK
jgi:hypothetical protein